MSNDSPELFCAPAPVQHAWQWLPCVQQLPSVEGPFCGWNLHDRRVLSG